MSCSSKNVDSVLLHPLQGITLTLANSHLRTTLASLLLLSTSMHRGKLLQEDANMAPCAMQPMYWISYNVGAYKGVVSVLNHHVAWKSLQKCYLFLLTVMSFFLMKSNLKQIKFRWVCFDRFGEKTYMVLGNIMLCPKGGVVEIKRSYIYIYIYNYNPSGAPLPFSMSCMWVNLKLNLIKYRKSLVYPYPLVHNFL